MGKHGLFSSERVHRLVSCEVWKLDSGGLGGSAGTHRWKFFHSWLVRVKSVYSEAMQVILDLTSCFLQAGCLFSVEVLIHYLSPGADTSTLFIFHRVRAATQGAECKEVLDDYKTKYQLLVYFRLSAGLLDDLSTVASKSCSEITSCALTVRLHQRPTSC